MIVPANCTDRLQPLDLSINRAAKESHHENVRVVRLADLQLAQGKVEKKPIDLPVSKVKPLGAK